MSRFDLAGNPLSDADVPAPSLAPEVLISAGQPWATVPPPLPIYHPPLTDSVWSSDDVPPEIARLKWNWGAFFLPPFWCASNGYRVVGYLYDLLVVLLVLSPFLYGPVYGRLIFWGLAFVMFDIGMYLGAKGNQIAWRNRVYDGPADFLSVQRGWMIAGFAVALPLDLLLCGWMASATQQEMHRRQAQQEQAVPARRAATPAPTTPTYQSPSPVVIMRRSPSDGNGTDNPNFPVGTQSPNSPDPSQPVAPRNTQPWPPSSPPMQTAPTGEGTGTAGSNSMPSSATTPITDSRVSGQPQAPPSVAAPPAAQPMAAPPPPGLAPGQ